MRVCMCVCIHVCIHVHIHVCIHVRIHVCIHVCTYVFIYVCKNRFYTTNCIRKEISKTIQHNFRYSTNQTISYLVGYSAIGGLEHFSARMSVLERCIFEPSRYALGGWVVHVHVDVQVGAWCAAWLGETRDRAVTRDGAVIFGVLQWWVWVVVSTSVTVCRCVDGCVVN